METYSSYVCGPPNLKYFKKLKIKNRKGGQANLPYFFAFIGL